MPNILHELSASATFTNTNTSCWIKYIPSDNFSGTFNPVIEFY